MGKWKGDSNPGGPGGRTQRIRSKKASGAHKNGCAVTALAMVGGMLALVAYGISQVIS